MAEELRKTIPMHLRLMKDTYKSMRKSESDLFTT